MQSILFCCLTIFVADSFIYKICLAWIFALLCGSLIIQKQKSLFCLQEHVKKHVYIQTCTSTYHNIR